MPLQNRVAPDGAILSTPSRGTMMGNRGGRIHRDDRTLGPARWCSKAWICCVLSFKNRQRAVMGQGYTEVFFLDEATALASGHRPCFECRRKAALRFATLFGDGTRTPAPDMDRILHAERLAPRPPVAASDLPRGALFAFGGGDYLATGEGMRRWSFDGYGLESALPDAAVMPHTPPSIISVMRRGYAASLHQSAV